MGGSIRLVKRNVDSRHAHGTQRASTGLERTILSWLLYTHNVFVVVRGESGQGGHLEGLGRLGLLDEQRVHEENDPPTSLCTLDPARPVFVCSKDVIARAFVTC